MHVFVLNRYISGIMILGLIIIMYRSAEMMRKGAMRVHIMHMVNAISNLFDQQVINYVY